MRLAPSPARTGRPERADAATRPGVRKPPLTAISSVLPERGNTLLSRLSVRCGPANARRAGAGGSRAPTGCGSWSRTTHRSPGTAWWSPSRCRTGRTGRAAVEGAVSARHSLGTHRSHRRARRSWCRTSQLSSRCAAAAELTVWPLPLPVALEAEAGAPRHGPSSESTPPSHQRSPGSGWSTCPRGVSARASCCCVLIPMRRGCS